MRSVTAKRFCRFSDKFSCFSSLSKEKEILVLKGPWQTADREKNSPARIHFIGHSVLLVSLHDIDEDWTQQTLKVVMTEGFEAIVHQFG